VIPNAPLDGNGTHGLARVAWIDDTHVAALVGSGGVLVFDAGKPGDAQAPQHSYALDARELAIRGRRTAILASDTAISTLDLETGCLRSSEPLELATGAAARPLVAFDVAHGRVFAVTLHAFVRLDVDLMKVAVEAPVPRDVVALAYDPTSDRVIARGFGDRVAMFEASTLVKAASVQLAHRPTGGPWVRPGHAQAAFSYDLQCEHFAAAPPGPPRMRGPPCLEKPETLGTRIVRLDLSSGGVLATDVFGVANDVLSDPQGTWSADGKRFVVADALDGELFEIDRAPTILRLTENHGAKLAWSDEIPLPLALDTTGTRFVGELGGYYVQVGTVATGQHVWTGTLPAPH
jgi:hypothetical protein